MQQPFLSSFQQQQPYIEFYPQYNKGQIFNARGKLMLKLGHSTATHLSAQNAFNCPHFTPTYFQQHIISNNEIQSATDMTDSIQSNTNENIILSSNQIGTMSNNNPIITPTDNTLPVTTFTGVDSNEYDNKAPINVQGADATTKKTKANKVMAEEGNLVNDAIIDYSPAARWYTLQEIIILYQKQQIYMVYVDIEKVDIKYYIAQCKLHQQYHCIAICKDLLIKYKTSLQEQQQSQGFNGIGNNLDTEDQPTKQIQQQKKRFLLPFPLQFLYTLSSHDHQFFNNISTFNQSTSQTPSSLSTPQLLYYSPNNVCAAPVISATLIYDYIAANRYPQPIYLSSLHNPVLVQANVNATTDKTKSQSGSNNSNCNNNNSDHVVKRGKDIHHSIQPRDIIQQYSTKINLLPTRLSILNNNNNNEKKQQKVKQPRKRLTLLFLAFYCGLYGIPLLKLPFVDQQITPSSTTQSNLAQLGIEQRIDEHSQIHSSIDMSCFGNSTDIASCNSTTHMNDVDQCDFVSKNNQLASSQISESYHLRLPLQLISQHLASQSYDLDEYNVAIKNPMINIETLTEYNDEQKINEGNKDCQIVNGNEHNKYNQFYNCYYYLSNTDILTLVHEISALVTPTSSLSSSAAANHFSTTTTTQQQQQQQEQEQTQNQITTTLLPIQPVHHFVGCPCIYDFVVQCIINLLNNHINILYVPPPNGEDNTTSSNNMSTSNSNSNNNNNSNAPHYAVLFDNAISALNIELSQNIAKMCVENTMNITSNSNISNTDVSIIKQITSSCNIQFLLSILQHVLVHRIFLNTHIPSAAVIGSIIPQIQLYHFAPIHPDNL